MTSTDDEPAAVPAADFDPVAGEAMSGMQRLIGYRLDVLLFRKVQRVTVRQSWFQARRGLAELRVYLASGSVRIPYIPYEAAAALRDYILYKVESSDRSWH